METQKQETIRPYIRGKRALEKITEIVYIGPLIEKWCEIRETIDSDYVATREILGSGTRAYTKIRVYARHGRLPSLVKEIGKTIETENLTLLERRGKAYETLAQRLSEKYSAKLTRIKTAEGIREDYDTREKERLYNQRAQRRKSWRRNY